MTRRGLLPALSAGWISLALEAQQPAHKPLPKLPPKLGEFLAYLDPSTENIVVRLTDPGYTSRSPAPQNRHVASRSPLMLFSNDRHGVMAPFTLELKTAVLKQLAEPKELKTDTLLLDSADRSCLFLDGQILNRVSLDRGKPRTLAEGVEDFHSQGLRDEIVILRQGKLERIDDKGSTVLAEGAGSRGLISPAGDACCFTREQSDGQCSLHIVSMGGGQPVEAARGAITCPTWSPDNQTVLFLRESNHEDAPASELWEAPVDGSGARFISSTSRFATFSPNGNGSVFVGASRSQAQPHVVLMLRAAHREMTLCEHRSSRPELVRPVFSPNSQRVYFQSDRHGKPALYTLSVAQLVEPTQPAS
jgi:oligogalacturonide lyase